MKKVFISYSHNDINVAKTICRYLEEKRITCWFSGRDIIPGQKWSGEIFRAIKECEVVILVHSKNYSYSDNALREIDNASNFKKQLYLSLSILRQSGMNLNTIYQVSIS